jgi:hypothetical protein
MRTRPSMSVAMLVLAVGCSSSSGGSPTGSAGTNGQTSGLPAGIDGSKQVVDATDADKTATCDWFASLVGGYGTAPICAGPELSAPASQADCVTQFPSCDVTFSDFAACVIAVTSAQNQQPCDPDAVQTAVASSTCGAIPVSCFGTTN